MIGRVIFSLLLSFGLVTTGLGADELRGKFVLFTLPKEGTKAPEAMEFMADGTCILEVGGHAGVKGTFRTDADSKLTLKYGAEPKAVLTYHYCLLTFMLTFCQSDGSDIYYMRPPSAPHPEFKDLVGIFLAHNDLGDAVTEITPDHRFRAHLHSLDNNEKSYYDTSMDGTCTYADGIITYIPEHDNSPEKSKYFRDFVVKCDEKGMSIIDFLHDNVLLETPAKTFDLPDLPKGYKLKNP
jgi:hypothetical protein